MRVSSALMIRLIVFLTVCAWSANGHAIPISQDFSGVELTVVGEFISAVPVDVGLQEFAPSFQTGQTVTGSIAYDTDQPDTDPGPYGTYRIGTLSVNVPELGLSASRSSSAMQISAFDNTPVPGDEFFAFVNGVDSFSSSVGLPNPLSYSVALFGDTTMLTDDLLPTSPLDWTFGNLSFDFRASDSSRRQVLMTFRPAPVSSVPEPGTLLLLGGGLGGLLVVRLRARMTRKRAFSGCVR
jgi:hypothetical protein